MCHKQKNVCLDKHLINQTNASITALDGAVDSADESSGEDFGRLRCGLLNSTDSFARPDNLVVDRASGGIFGVRPMTWDSTWHMSVFWAGRRRIPTQLA
jgi:hypothetical protein